MLWKSPRFVSAPNKILADALRIRKLAQRSTTASADVSDAEGPKKSSRVTNEPFNAFVIAYPKFGLTVDELRTEVEKQVHDAMGLIFDIQFLPREEVVLKAIPRTLSGADLQQVLENIKAPLISAIATKGYGTAELCATDSSLNILRRESDGGPGDGWSKVAAKKAASKNTLAPGDGYASRSGNTFSALGDGKVTFAKKKPVERVKLRKPIVVDLVDDWEAAELAEEEKERASGASGDEGVDASGTDNKIKPEGTAAEGGSGSVTADFEVRAAAGAPSEGTAAERDNQATQTALDALM